MSRVTEHGLPHSVDSIDKLPAHAYDGHLCYVKSESDGGLYVYNGEDYEVVSASSDGIASRSASIPVYDTVTAFPSEAPAGQMAFANSTKAVYFFNGTTWKKLGEASA